MEAARRCGFCQDPLFSIDLRQKYCCRACGNRGTAAARKATYRERARERAEEIFGTLSDHEFDLVTRSDARGYQRGYQTARLWKDPDEEVA
jgi:hypothetical protein